MQEASAGVQDGTSSRASGRDNDPGAVMALASRGIWRSAACTSAAPLLAKHTCAGKSRTQGAYPLFWCRAGFWLVNPAKRPR